MKSEKPRAQVAIAFARNFAAGIIQNAELAWQQQGTTLTDDEIDIASKELERIAQRIENKVKLEMLAQATLSEASNSDQNPPSNGLTGSIPDIKQHFAMTEATMKDINVFAHDHWELKSVADLAKGDLISHEGTVATVIAPAYEKDGITHIPAEPYGAGPIKLMVGEFTEGKQHILMAMDLVGSDLVEFDDGTGLIADLEKGNNLVFSPRLPIAELEAFCTKHIDDYQAFYDANIEKIDDGQAIPMTPWWK